MCITKPFMSSNINSNKGFAVVSLVLMVIALMAVIAGAIAISSRSYNAAVAINNTVTQLVAQANLIRQKVTQCVIEYSEGDNGTGFHKTYPAGTNVDVSTLTCPGAPAGSNNLWTGSDSVFLPNPPVGFNAWKYTNDATSVRISIQTTNVSGYGTAMSKAAAKFSSSEASVSGDTLTVTITL